MANTFLDNKISSFIEEKFPEFVKTDHPVFVEFLRFYYQFLETAKIKLTNIQESDQILLESALTVNYLLMEDGTKITTDDSAYGVFINGENITGQTSGAISKILAEDSTANSAIYVEQNRYFVIGEVIVGSTSGATASIGDYQGNPVQNIQQLLEYSDADKTLSIFLDRFRNSYLHSIPNTLASGVSKRSLIKNVRDMYRAKGSKRGHELFFRLLFDETPEIFYPTDNLLKISGGTWVSDYVIRIKADEGDDPTKMVGQTITQSVNAATDTELATAACEQVVEMTEGESIIAQLFLDLNSIDGTFVVGEKVKAVANDNADVTISGTIQSIITDATVSDGASMYSTSDLVTVTSSSGSEAQIDIVDVGSGSVQELIIDTPGANYNISDDIYFDSAGTQGSGASAKITVTGGAISLGEAGDFAEYGAATTDHVVFEDATEETDAYTGNQCILENQTLLGGGDSTSNPQNWAAENIGSIEKILMFSGGSGYETLPSVTLTEYKLTFSETDADRSGTFTAGETITAAGGASAKIAVVRSGSMTVAKTTGSFVVNEKITGGSSSATAKISTIAVVGTGAKIIPWSTTGVGSVKGIEISKFGTGFGAAPIISFPLKVLITKAGSTHDVSQTSSFAVGDSLTGQLSSATGTVTAWDNNLQLLTISPTNTNTFRIAENIRRGSTSDYALIAKTNRASATTTIGTLGKTAGQFNDDKGKISESVMKIQDSYYYQDFSYVVRISSSISQWKNEIKKALHPAGFNVFGEVSFSTQLSARMVSPVELAGVPIPTETPELASMFEATISQIIGRRLGTQTDGTTLNTEFVHETPLTTTISGITYTTGSPTGTAVIQTSGPHNIVVGETVEIQGVTTAGYNGIYVVSSVTSNTVTVSAASGLSTTIVLSAFATIKLHSGFNRSTRDVTLQSKYEIPVTIQPVTGFASTRANRYGLGSTKKTAVKYLWSVGAVSDTTSVRMDNISYAYPNLTRRQMPESGTDNVTAGTAGAYDSTMNYTNIQIGDWELNSQMTLDSFADVRIDEVVRPDRIIAESGTVGMDNFGEDRSYFLAESGTHSTETWSSGSASYTYESDMYIESFDGIAATGDSETIPTTSGKFWNVPPPSYIRGVKHTGSTVTSGVGAGASAYNTWDDNTKPPSFDDNTSPPSFDAESGT